MSGTVRLMAVMGASAMLAAAVIGCSVAGGTSGQVAGGPTPVATGTPRSDAGGNPGAVADRIAVAVPELLCGGICPASVESVPIEIDGHAGKLLRGPDDVDAFVKIGGKVYAMAAWYAWAEPNLRAFVSTMHVDGSDAASPSPS